MLKVINMEWKAEASDKLGDWIVVAAKFIVFSIIIFIPIFFNLTNLKRAQEKFSGKSIWTAS